MRDPIAKYLNKRAVHRDWPLSAHDAAGIEQAVVIPALAESENLFHTLDDLEANPPGSLEHTLVIVVVNNRAAPHAGAEDLADNQRTLAKLEARRAGAALRLAYVDAASPGRELPPKDGVGLARKIGLDHACALLHQNGRGDAPLVSLDADTRVGPGYLPVLREHFQHAREPWASILDYAHPLDGPEEHRRAILDYELYLRAHELGLRRAGSPYAFPTIGSTIACTPRAYAAVGGMRRKQAAEDFYFLQDLAKTGPIHRIHGAAVRPAARPSHRVPFGTGATLQKNDEQTLYHPGSYRVLASFLENVSSFIEHDLSGEDFARHAQPHALHDFLLQCNFPNAWDNIRKNTPDPERRRAQFHRWFDALRTLRLFHHLRGRGYPDQPLYEALPILLRWTGADAELAVAAPRRLLDALRKLPIKKTTDA